MLPHKPPPAFGQHDAAKPEGRSKIRLLSLLRSRRAIIYLVVVLVVVLVEHGDQILGGLGFSQCDDVSLAARMFYQRFALAGQPFIQLHRVRLITYSVDSIPVIANPCDKRALVAGLIRRAAIFNPSEIVIDHTYGEGVCENEENKKKSDELESALREISSKIPIVIGLDSRSLDEIQRDLDFEKLMQSGFSRKDQFLLPSKSFTGPQVYAGLTRLDCDNRRIPISWSVYPSRADVLNHGAKISKPSLPFLAANVAAHGKLDMLTNNNAHPFSGFVSESEFQPITGSSLLCLPNFLDMADSMVDSKHCKLPSTVDLNSLSGSIVLFGEDTQSDWHRSVLGTVPGYLLQANYIDALLAGYYFRPVNGILEVFLTLLGILLLVNTFEATRSFTLNVILAIVVVLAIVAICSLVATYLKWFIGSWLALVPLFFIELLFEIRSRRKV